MSRWLFPWSGSIKKRACRYLLQHYLGHFLQERLSLEQLGLDLYNGNGVIKDINLDVWVSLWRNKKPGWLSTPSRCCRLLLCTLDCFATALEFNNNLQRHVLAKLAFLRGNALRRNPSPPLLRVLYFNVQGRHIPHMQTGHFIRCTGLQPLALTSYFHVFSPLYLFSNHHFFYNFTGGQRTSGVSWGSPGDSGWFCEQHNCDHPLASSPD